MISLRKISILGAIMMTINPAFADVASGIKALEKGEVDKSVTIFQEAFEGGDPDGAFYIGRLFELGLGTQKDLRRAAELYAAASNKGSAKAQNRLGLMHLNGEVVLQDYKRAGELICQSADQGEANGEFNCGLLYHQGKGFAINHEKAVEYWTKAADKSNVAAINFLGQAYQTGKGVTIDQKKAISFFERTGNAGNPLGLFELAKAYANQLGVETDFVKAHLYANLAAVRGLEDAIKLRDELAKKMTPDQLLEAQKMAREWKSNPFK